MKFDLRFIENLKAELSHPLPGETAQFRMAPSYRPNLRREEIMKYNPRISAVMLLLFKSNDELKIVFTERKKYEGVHSGQISFPGGRKDNDDDDLLQTALRETKEEVGVAAAQIEILGRLSELYIPPSNFLVYPSVGFAENIAAFTPQQNEVESIVEIPVDFFLDAKNINLKAEIKLFNNHTVHVPAYIYNKHTIWGATAIMLSEFTYIAEKAMTEL